MPFCPDCGKQLDDGAMSCVDCGSKPELVAKAKGHSTWKKKVQWFLAGLVIILLIGGVLYWVEDATLPSYLKTQIYLVKEWRKADPDIQRIIAWSQGKTVKELLTMPYTYWSPKVLVGLLSTWGGAWAIYLAWSFFRFVDREGPR